MKLDRVIIEGFRSYRTKTEIDISQLTALIGENDIGKTTILDALNAFFNNVIEFQDYSKNYRKSVSIGCVFSDVPEKILLNSESYILPKEYKVLNRDNKLEIYKEWFLTPNHISLRRVYFRSYAPVKGDMRNLIQKDKRDLQEIMKRNRIKGNSANATEMRREIYNHFENKKDTSDIGLQDVNVNIYGSIGRNRIASDLRKLYNALDQRYFPFYALFKTEQLYEKGGIAINSTMEVSLQLALREFSKELSVIHNEVTEKVSERAKRVIDRIKEDYPDILLDIHPSYKPPNWLNAFSLEEFQSDDDIPLGKRGSGLRRIAMLAFFQEEVNRERDDRISDQHNASVIYAIEEPEISQHPNLLRNIVEALKDLSDSGDQVILTTHVPDLMKLLPEDSIRFIDRVSGKNTRRVRSITSKNTVLERISERIGFHSTTSVAPNLQVIVWVEGITDVRILQEFASILEKAGKFPKGLDLNRVLFDTIGGYNNVVHKLSINHYKHIKVPHFYLLDSDKSSKSNDGKSVDDSLTERVKKWKNTRRGMPIDYTRTRKREIENYIHKDAIDSAYGSKIDWDSIASDFDWNFGRICKGGNRNSKKDGEISLWEIMEKSGILSKKKKIENSSLKSDTPKNVISTLIVKSMKYEYIVERCKETDPESSKMCEVEEWFHKIANLVT